LQAFSTISVKVKQGEVMAGKAVRVEENYISSSCLTGNLFFKIQMIMPAAVWIECSPAIGTMVIGIKILVNGQFFFANTT
jgi:hypothetical protein